MIVVQHLWTQWTKASRGAAAARPRLNAPRPLAPPSGSGGPGQAWIHDIHRKEREDFERREDACWATQADWSRRHHANNLGWKETAGGRVELRLVPPSPGLRQTRWPEALPSPLLILEPGETARIVWNARFRNSIGGSNRGSFYEEHLILVAAAEAPAADLFVGSTARRTVDLTTGIY